jgi:hypothetical protein
VNLPFEMDLVAIFSWSPTVGQLIRCPYHVHHGILKLDCVEQPILMNMVVFVLIMIKIP